MQERGTHTGNDSHFFIPLYVFLLFAATYLIYGFYYGWVDDVYALNLMKGTLSVRGYEPTDQFFLISKAIIWLYDHWPQVPWFGLFLLLAAYFSAVNIFYFFEKILAGKDLHIAARLLFYLAIFLLFFAENIILLNFTRIAILLTGSAMLRAYQAVESGSRYRTGWYFLQAFTGYLIRFDAALLTIFIILIFIAIHSIDDKRRLRRALLVPSVIFLLILAHVLFHSTMRTGDFAAHDKTRPYIFNLLDGSNLNDLEKITDPKDSMRLAATLSWYYHDKEQIDLEFFKRIGGKEIMSFNTFRKWRWNVREEYRKMSYRREVYESGLNLVSKFHLLNAFNLSVVIIAFSLFLSKRITKSMLLKMAGFIAAFYLVFFMSTTLVKYEDRLYAPASVLLFLINISWLLAETGKQDPVYVRKLSLILICSIVPFGAIRAGVLYEMAAEKRFEVEAKQAFISELNSFEGKKFMYDLWSITLLHGDPLQEIFLDKRNTHTIYGDSYYHDVSAHRNFVKDKVCGFEKFVDFYNCALGKNDVVFIFSDIRAGMLPDYFRILYGKEMNFVPAAEHSALEKINYSFIWQPLHFNYYQLK